VQFLSQVLCWHFYVLASMLTVYRSTTFLITEGGRGH